ncbi:cyclophilin-like fold protein [Staphylococcus sp. NAM3COL9]|uniref:cyclophilin-like fold protein n=1 Tax=Staphylococcus sp. NAM3COL9 TaxID=1667172 RepID=UPI00070A60AF|nr:cyclophilin-like fold protein [Staphylococcus sp. NAM3COL9]
MSKVTFTIDSITFSANIFDNVTSQYLLEKLPLSITMHDLNNNEKYHDFNDAFPTNMQEIKHIHKGDIMLYQDSYLVIFYKSFTTTFSYTPVGTITHPDSLDVLNSISDVDITIKSLS